MATATATATAMVIPNIRMLNMSLFNFLNRGSETLVDVDIHSHLIPSIDDGAKDLERSIELILKLQEMGYKKLITTPHVSDMFPNSTEVILNGYKTLKEELNKRKIEIEIEVAAEYYADETFERLLKNRDILTFGKEKYLLFELSYFTRPRELESLIHDIKMAGYVPVLAHPERYVYFHDSIEEYTKIKALGVLFQINLNSIVNYYSEEIGKVVKELINRGMVNFVGSDTHHRRHVKFLEKSLQNSFYKKVFKKNKILNNTL
ncbi:MAG: Capsular polysaccharide synthesis enzyme Cap8C Manganese-dependent protein-tyrosine phosphatase [uncultured Sulfurovum sp.]|uniref:protein-tyrosine-phosphatase n=1 Tax=uncultured Sulfurovum sp. TaxID=269237 RepID=A0A6S6U2J1_9BACT|nr:MAG: Capsular polysaccharide synthesis enzyme Cap8C Manganese-dependent protein-tyrosine phosphatase [uncultured Sulfurovum sp.]